MDKRNFQAISVMVISLLLISACSKCDSLSTTAVDCPTCPECPECPENEETLDCPPAENLEAVVHDQPTGCHSSEKLNSILWVQASGEYLMAATQSYALAKVMLDRGLADPNWTAALEQTGNYSDLPPAVIVDVDETVLDNTPFHASMELMGKNWDTDLFYDWTREARAEAVPGAVDFLQYAHSKGVTVFYMTNRVYDVEDATRENLKNNGFPMESGIDTLLMHGEKEGWESSKVNRRTFLAENYRILLLFGDTLNDFLPGTNVGAVEREAVLRTYQDYWNEKWILIPNPIYGGWEGAIYDFDYSLSKEQIFDSKVNSLEELE